MQTNYYLQEAAAAKLFPEDEWFKAAASGGGQGGEGCVEVNLSQSDNDQIGVRHSKMPNAGAFVFDRNEWASFLDGAKGGEFDLPA
jgi:hypothetical protein